MKSREELDQWRPALPREMGRGSQRPSQRVVLKILEVCAGSMSVSIATAMEALENFEVQEVMVFSVDGKPSAHATRTVDVLTYDWENDEQLRRFRHDREEGVAYIYYAHASPPCGPYSSMACRHRGSIHQRDLRWGDSVAQRCIDLMTFFHPDYWTLESRGPPGLDSRSFMQSLEPQRTTINYCRYGWNRWKATSIWTNVQSWEPEPRCLPSNRCAHSSENGKHMERMQKHSWRSPDFAALPERLVRAWTRAALAGILGCAPPGSSGSAGVAVTGRSGLSVLSVASRATQNTAADLDPNSRHLTPESENQGRIDTPG